MSRLGWFGLGVSLFSFLAFSWQSWAATLPELPRVYVDTNDLSPPDRTIAVQNGGDLQAALNRAKPGDVIALEAGAIFTGPFTLPRKSGSGWITVRTSVPDSEFPPPGHRVDPSYAKLMPKIEGRGSSVIAAERGAHHYRFIGIQIRPRQGSFLYNLVLLGSSETSVGQLPHHIIFDRCYIHGDPKKGTRRGIAMNGKSIAVIDSYLSDFKEVGRDSQAIAGWNGPGPFKIVNNYLEAAGENVMFGGSDPKILNLVPSDIEIRQNHFFKPLSWKVDDPSFGGTAWTIKNLFELKNARRVLIESNLFENNWVHGQSGFAVLFTVRNQSGGAPWSVVEDVTFRKNIVRRAASAVNILGTDNIYPSQKTKRILIKDNLFDDIGGAQWGGGGRGFQLLDGTADVVIDHNTIFHTAVVVLAEGAAHVGFVYRNNLAPHNDYGVGGTDTTGNPMLTLSTYFPGAVFVRNILAGGKATQYPPDNFFPPSLDAVGFVNRAGRDYRLAASSRYKKAGTDGRDVGVDFDALSAAVGPAAPSQRERHSPVSSEKRGNFKARASVPSRLR